VTVAGATSWVFSAATDQFTATAKDTSGNGVTGASVSWASSAPAVATIDSKTGIAKAISPGITQITAAIGNVTSVPVALTVTAPSLLSASVVVTAGGLSGVAIDGYQLISVTQNDATHFDYAYSAIAHNNSANYVANVGATLATTSSATGVVSPLIAIGDIAAGVSKQVSGPLILRQDVTIPFDATALTWTLAGIPIVGAVPPPDPGAAGDASLAGIDANGNGVRDDVERWILIKVTDASTRKALFQVSAALQVSITSGTSSTQAAQGELLLVRSVECLTAVSPSDGRVLSATVESIVMNTVERARAYFAFGKLIAGVSISGVDPNQLSSSCQ
jgi:hypothetical protein